MATTTITDSVNNELTPGQIIERFQNEAPVDVVGLAEALGINVWQDALTPPISGKLFIDKLNGGTSGFSIVINKAEPLPRQRFTVAHEIAHFILHKEDLADGLAEDALFRGRLSNNKEIEANKLAAEILMPFRLIQKLMTEGFRTISQLAEELQVSKAAISIRLGVAYTD